METSIEQLLIQNIIDNEIDNHEMCPIIAVSDSSSSDSDDSDEFLIPEDKIHNFMEIIESFSDERFRKHFRLTRETISSLVDLYESSDLCPSHNHGGNAKVGAKKETHMFLWYVANIITYRQMGNLFGLSDSTTWNVVNRVSSWLVRISHEYIVWPRSNQAIQRTTTSFEQMNRISGVLGAIDGSHIEIRKPSTNPQIYFNRKGYHSVLLQAVVNSKKRFIDVYCREPGSMHDARVLRRSPLFRLASQGEVFKGNTFLLGDSAYRSNFWIVPPFKDTGNLTSQQTNFNKIHSSTRIVVENAFGMMKCRFRRLLHFTEHCDLATVKNVIIACCVLHNICINLNDPWEEDESEDEFRNNTFLEGEDTQAVSRQVDRRAQVFNDLISKNLL